MVKKKATPKGKFEYRGSEFELYKDTVRINGTKWRKIKH